MKSEKREEREKKENRKFGIGKNEVREEREKKENRKFGIGKNEERERERRKNETRSTRRSLSRYVKERVVSRQTRFTGVIANAAFLIRCGKHYFKEFFKSRHVI